MHACRSTLEDPTRPRCTGYRLPSEKEWEYAARAGTETAVYAGTHSDEVLSRIAWYKGTTTQPVADPRKQPNAFGLHEMIGNVWEWTGEAYNDDARKNGDASAVPDGDAVVRGCGFDDTAGSCRAAYRGGVDPAFRVAGRGFRPARSIP